jgi:hypothetical protein
MSTEISKFYSAPTIASLRREDDWTRQHVHKIYMNDFVYNLLDLHRNITDFLHRFGNCKGIDH